MVWCSIVWCGVVLCGVVLCGALLPVLFCPFYSPPLSFIVFQRLSSSSIVFQLHSASISFFHRLPSSFSFIQRLLASFSVFQCLSASFNVFQCLSVFLCLSSVPILVLLYERIIQIIAMIPLLSNEAININMAFNTENTPASYIPEAPSKDRSGNLELENLTWRRRKS